MLRPGRPRAPGAMRPARMGRRRCRRSRDGRRRRSSARWPPSSPASARARSWTVSRRASPTRRPARSRPGTSSRSKRRAMRTNRRQFLKTASAAALLPMPAIAQGAGPKVVVIGGGFAGATAARFIKMGNNTINVTLVEANPTFTACPFSNAVIAGLRELKAQQFNYEQIEKAKVSLAFQQATEVDAQVRSVTLRNGTKLPYDRLVMAPGIDLRWDG